MTLADDLLHIAKHLETGTTLGTDAAVLRRAADALTWRRVEDDPPPLGEYVLIWVPTRPWISRSPTVFAKVAKRRLMPGTRSGYTWDDFGPGSYSDYEIAAWMPVPLPPEPEPTR